MSNEDIMKVWKNYKDTNDAKLKEKLIIEYAPLVKYMAGRLNIYLGQNVEYEDLVGYGVFGLIDAIDKFDLEKKVKFETYASLRIRGSIIDSIRKMDWVPRSLRQKYKQFEKVYSEIENELGRPAKDEEVAERMNLSKEEYDKMLKKINILSLISLDEYLDQKYENNSISSLKSDEMPEKFVEKQELKDILCNAINNLPEKEKKVVTLYYFESLTLKEISVILKVSESRISQLHSKAILRLKGKLGKNKNILLGI